MTRKDYVKLATLIKTVKNVAIDGNVPVYLFNHGLIEILQQDNPRFNVKKWEDFING